MLIAHLSDLHLRETGDVIWLERQLDRIAARAPDHLAITGDLLDRWHPALFDRLLDALQRRDFLSEDRLTILHGNHDLESLGGHPRRGADLWRLLFRFWDPPPLLAARRTRFYDTIRHRAAGVGSPPPWRKTVRSGLTIALVDTIPAFWLPVRLRGRVLHVRHAVGCIARAHTDWLAAQRPATGPLVALMHHFPLPTPPFRWTPDRLEPPSARLLRWLEAVEVRMEIVESDRDRFWKAARTANVRLVLCGHVHRARLEWHDGIAVGLNGQSGAAWAGRTIAWYEVENRDVRMEVETVS